jgi:hypothetical protein
MNEAVLLDALVKGQWITVRAMTPPKRRDILLDAFSSPRMEMSGLPAKLIPLKMGERKPLAWRSLNIREVVGGVRIPLVRQSGRQDS